MADLTNKKSRFIPYIYLLGMLIFLSGSGLLILLNINAVSNYFFFALTIALGLGILHITALRRFLLPELPANFLKGLATTVVLMVVSCLLLFLIYHYLRLNYNFITFEFGFIIPVFVWLTYRFFTEIPAGEFKLWYYPTEENMPDLDMIDLSEIEVVQFVFNKKPEDAKKINFTCKAPLNMSLGQLFFIFINDYNEKNSQQTIGYLDEGHQPHGWLFYKESGFLKSKYYYDPELSFRQNSIIPNQTIYAIRQLPAEQQPAIAVK